MAGGGRRAPRSRECLTAALLSRNQYKVFRFQITQNLYSPMDKASGQRSPCPTFEPRTSHFFDFSLFSFFMELPWRASARMSIRLQYLLAVDLFAEDACFLETYFLETCFLETCFLETCFLETCNCSLFGGWNYTKKILTHKLFISFSERGVISTPMDARGTNTRARVP